MSVDRPSGGDPDRIVVSLGDLDGGDVAADSSVVADSPSRRLVVDPEPVEPRPVLGGGDVDDTIVRDPSRTAAVDVGMPAPSLAPAPPGEVVARGDHAPVSAKGLRTAAIIASAVMLLGALLPWYSLRTRAADGGATRWHLIVPVGSTQAESLGVDLDTGTWFLLLVALCGFAVATSVAAYWPATRSIAVPVAGVVALGAIGLVGYLLVDLMRRSTELRSTTLEGSFADLYPGPGLLVVAVAAFVVLVTAIAAVLQQRRAGGGAPAG